MSDREQLVAEYLENNPPSSNLDHCLAYAYLKVNHEVTQKQYAEAVGINDRSLRKWISENKDDYEEAVERYEAEVEKPLDLSILSSRSISEEQLDKFVDVLYKSAITGNARDKALFIEFTGLTAENVMDLQSIKQRSLRWMIKGELSSISQYLDPKQLGVMMEESPYLYRGDKQSSGNSNNFVQADITDEAFVREMAYFGMLFTSLYNQTAHPDMDVVAQAVRLDRLEQGTAQALNRNNIKQYAEGANIKPKVSKPVTDEQLITMWMELGDNRHTATERVLEAKKAKQVVKPAEIKPDVVRERATQHEDALQVLVSVEDEIKHLLKLNK